MSEPFGASPIGAAALMRLAFDGVDLLPLRLQLIDRYIFEPENTAALMDLAVVEQVFGNLDIGLARQAEALSLCRLYRSPSSAASGLRLLAFAAAGDIGTNIPLEFLIEGSDIELHTLYVVPGLPLPQRLPEHDVAIVAVGESDTNRAALAEIAALAPHWPCPVLNRPEHIARLGRERLFELLHAIDGVFMPPTRRVGRDALRRLGGAWEAGRDRRCASFETAVSRPPQDEGRLIALQNFPHAEERPAGASRSTHKDDEISWPLVVRPVGSHAGRGLAKLDDIASLGAYLAERREREFHLSPFVDYRGADGLFRKYRIAFIDGVAYPVHMAVLDQWQILYLNAGMDKGPAKRAEEAHFLTSFATDFDRRHGPALNEVATRVDLDYFGIDCAELPDGRLLVFEADIAQVVHNMDPPELFPYKGPAMRKLFAAFQGMLRAKSIAVTGSTVG
jgi:hypothetical protein